MAEVQEPVVDNESRWKGTHHDLPHEPPQTRYSVMAVQANNIRTRHNASAAVFSWITLAGFVTLPNTFTSLQTSSSLSESTGGRIAQDTVHNVQLLPFAGVLCCIGLSGTCFLWRKHQGNYIWLVGHLFQ